MGGVIIEEQEINCSQYLDLVYSKSSTLYDLIPNAPFPSNDRSKAALEAHDDGMVGSVTTQYDTQPIVSTTKSTPSPSQSYEVNSFQYSSPQQPRGKKKNKGKSKNSSTRQATTKYQQIVVKIASK